MSCPDCDAEQVRLSVPAELREHAPEEAPAVAVCTRCLRIDPADADDPAGVDPRGISDALPADGTAAVALLLAVDRLSSLARNRAAIEALVARAERAGADPRLALERLADDPALDPRVDVERRLRQFDQLA